MCVMSAGQSISRFLSATSTTSCRFGIDCRFCHTAVEASSSAGLPPTYTCMTCHSQIWTNAALFAPVRESLATGSSRFSGVG